MLEIKQARQAGDYRLYLEFNNGKTGTADLKATIFEDSRGIFASLQDPARFQHFAVEHGTITWPDELDVAAEYLFYLAFRDDPGLQDQFQIWGYRT